MIDEFAKEYLHGDLRSSQPGDDALEARRPRRVRRAPSADSHRHQPPRLGQAPDDHRGLVLRRGVQAAVPDVVFPWRDGDSHDAKLAAYFEHKFQLADMWAIEHESRSEVVDRYQRAVWEHSDATIAALDIDAPGHVAWWPRPDVQLFNIMVHVLNETIGTPGTRTSCREQLDGAVGHRGGRRRPARARTRRSGSTTARRSSEQPRPRIPTEREAPRYIISPGSLLACLIQETSCFSSRSSSS